MKRDVLQEQNVQDSFAKEGDANKADRLAWFSKQGIGAFIHFSLDAQLGMVISHNLINANEDYCQRYFTQLPETFDPYQFDARRWARFFRSIGIRYVILTNKHHSGFCMWHTQTTPFSIANTPYGKDMTRDLFDACRAEGLAIGVYFSPDDFHSLWQQEITISRDGENVLPKDNPELMTLAKAQVRELLTDYGPIDMIFFDGDPTGLRDLAWELQPDCIVTRGALRTPEQHLPEVEAGQDPSTIEPWEACFTMGRQWQYRGLHEAYKSPKTIVDMLIRTRAGGGNLLMNFGPMADGRLPETQEAIMREVGMWLFVNHEAIYNVMPYHVSREGDTYYTANPDTDTVYAHLTNIDWPALPDIKTPEQATVDRDANLDSDGLYKARSRRITWRLKAVAASEDTTVSLMAQNTDVVSMRTFQKSLTWKQEGNELVIHAWYAHRQYNDWFWDMPMVVKIQNPAGIA